MQTALTSLSLMLVIYFVSKKTLFLVAILKARKYNVAKKPRVQTPRMGTVLYEIC